MADATEALEIVKLFGQYGGVSAVLAYAWWKAEKRADAAQSAADSRADQLMEAFKLQSATNNSVSTSLALLTAEVSRKNAG